MLSRPALREGESAVFDVEKAIISAGYRQLAKKAHPDAGGTEKDMVALSAARDRLIATLSTPRQPVPPRRSPTPPTVAYAPTFDLGRAIDEAAHSFFQAIIEPYSPRKRRRSRK
jgi:hypothetical protein